MQTKKTDFDATRQTQEMQAYIHSYEFII